MPCRKRRGSRFASDCGQKQLAQRFFAPTTVIDDTLNGEPFVPGLTSATILENACAYFECVVRQIVTLGDHAVVIMEVIDAECRRDLCPLARFASSPWTYGG